MVLRLEARDDEVIAPRRKAEFSEPIAAVGQDWRTVGDKFGRRVELCVVIVRDALRVGDQRVGPPHRQGLGHSVVAPSGASPLRTLPLETIDMRRDRNATRSQQR